ncbi:regulator of telomere elongation helicase 1 isoform X2 [Anguilla anguilla]|uniref:regulator of telomere elongation helicase 1 isoform X2 n=1 Tax=Anguilla anguilla TaxID=7936 RepID=UPI0015AB0766|nr:regulator of telomere elongation helicase 1 isoform X2 [Anguilla anguilla]
MPPITFKGVTVEFPFEPYECQKDYMTKVIECLQNKVNGILESPTGTGKTLCLLCATLAWRDYFKDTISARKIAEKLGGEELFPDRPLSSWGTAATDGNTPTYYTDIPKIIYATRTHSQLTQVVGELKNTSYRPKVCVLGSREQLCINPDVMRQESNHIKVHMCRAKVSTRSCIFYNNVEEKSTDKELANSIMDVEDLVKFGNKGRVCPYYLSRNLKQQADIIFMPYNYLLDHKSRKAHSIELNGAVIIFDEAHNVEKMCEESTSFDLTPYDMATAIKAVDNLLVEQARDAGKEGVNEDFNVDSLNSGLKLDITSIAKIKQILLDLEAAIDSFEIPDGKGVTKPGSFIYELFQRAQLTFVTKAAILEALEQIVGYLAGRPGIFHNTSGLQKLADIIELVFCAEPPEGSAGKHIADNTKEFKVHIHRDTSHNRKKQAVDVWASSSSKKQGNILSYWCFCPGFSMKELVRQGVRSIILTSGTLSPLSSFTSEMQIPFPVRLENPHVIQRDQIFVSVVDRGPDGVQLSSAFDRRFVPENMASLGNTIVNLGRVVPHGLLVFFPSYPVMDKTIEFWRANGHADRIEKLKPMFVEPRGKGTFTEVMDAYYSKVDDRETKGGSFFAVCRGKASEGLDFADTYGRGVVITGLPFPPMMDPKVILKMQYLDEMCRKALGGVRYLSGQEWYRQQASRAVNQAIGRVIRHCSDYGAIFLCDHRFKSADARSQLPSWVKPHLRSDEKFGNVVRDVAQFFRVAQKLRPPPEKKAVAAGRGAAWSSEAGASSSGSPSGGSHQPCPTLLSSFMPKAKALDSHVPSLKKRRLDDQATGGGTARLCIQYEADMDDRRKPTGLLDALEDSDRTRRDDRDHLPGEEKASRLSTLSLQHDKRLDDESRGGRRKIRLVQEPNKMLPQSSQEDTKAEKAKLLIAAMKRSLSQVNSHKILEALQTYKRTDDLDQLLLVLVELFTKDANTHILLREFYQFIQPHHKKRYDETCRELTGIGCGYKPEHSLSKAQKDKLMHQSDTSVLIRSVHVSDTPSYEERAAKAEKQTSLAAPASSHDQLNTSAFLNKGGSHLFHLGTSNANGEPPSRKTVVTPGQPMQKSKVYSAFIADVKNAFGTEKFKRLLMAVQEYKNTDNYESMVSEVVSLFTERSEGFSLLRTFSMFVRPQHKERFLRMVEDLSGGGTASPSPAPAAEDPQVRLEAPGSSETSARGQSKISAFFSSSQRK